MPEIIFPARPSTAELDRIDANTTMTKSDCINLISDVSNCYGDKLVAMMEFFGADNLRELTRSEVYWYWRNMLEN